MKHMKKSMFITTLAMVVVLVVALSTATFAWYTAQTTVSVTTTMVNSAASSAASLAIDKTANDASNNSEVTITMNGAIGPMIPVAKPTNQTVYSDFVANTNFFQAPINNDGDFTQNGSGVTPATIGTVKNATGDASSGTGFYVINTDAVNSTAVNVAVTINTTAYTLLKSKPNDFDADSTAYYVLNGSSYEAAAANATWAANTYYKANESEVYKDLRVAIFVDGTYVNTWSYEGGTARTYYGTISATNNAVSSLSYNDYGTLATSVTASIGTINPVSHKNIQVVAWFDGVGLEVDEASSSAFFAITFTVAS